MEQKKGGNGDLAEWHVDDRLFWRQVIGDRNLGQTGQFRLRNPARRPDLPQALRELPDDLFTFLGSTFCHEHTA